MTISIGYLLVGMSAGLSHLQQKRLAIFFLSNELLQNFIRFGLCQPAARGYDYTSLCSQGVFAGSCPVIRSAKRIYNYNL